MNRKVFLKNSTKALAIGIIPSKLSSDTMKEHMNTNDNWNYSNKDIQPNDEPIWNDISKIFPRNAGIVNLENGYFSHAALPVINFQQQWQNTINSEHSVFMRGNVNDLIEDTRNRFALFQQCNPESIAFTRNTTESLNIVIMGFPWNKNDEVIIGNQDYGSMVEAFNQASNRWGITIKTAEIPVDDCENYEDVVVNAYLKLITKQTRMIHLTHPINLNGQGLPISTLIEKIREINSNICIVVDAAHALSHFTETLGTMGADVIGSSLHKWTGNPLGLGCLFVSETWISQIWPLMGDTGFPKNNIRKFEHQGTRPIHSILSLNKAIEILEKIGLSNRRNRLRYLKYIWQGNKIALENISKEENFKLDSKIIDSVHDLTKLKGLKFQHPLKTETLQGAISTISVSKFTPEILQKRLIDDFNIFTVAINHPVIKGVRITPQLSNNINDVVKLNQAIFSLNTLG